MTTAARETAAGLAEFNAYYDDVHAGEVLAANPGFGPPRRYELDGEPDSATPRWLALYPIATGEHVAAYLDRQRDPGRNARTYTPGPPSWNDASFVWRAVWRLAAASAPPPGPVTALLVAGVDPPADATDAEMAEFTDFYDEGHVPDILEYGGYRSFARYEKIAHLPAALDGYPRFCSMYTTDVPPADLDGRAALAEAGKNGRLSVGPPIWQRRTTWWRLWFTPIQAAVTER
ncbi:hypothetical protein [Actinomadura meridiana]